MPEGGVGVNCLKSSQRHFRRQKHGVSLSLTNHLLQDEAKFCRGLNNYERGVIYSIRVLG